VSRAATIRLSNLLRDELERASSAMRYPGHPPPYFLSYLVRDEDIWVIDARYGALFEDSHTRRRDCLADVRVGSYKHDQVQDGGLHDNNREDESFGYVELPLSGSEDGVRHALWRLTESKYREAVDAFLRKRSVELTYKNAHPELRSFEKRDPIEDVRHRRFPPLDREAYRRYVIGASRELKKYPRLKNGYVKLTVRNATRTFVSSEGSLLVDTSPFWSLDIYVWYLSDAGTSFPFAQSFFVTDPGELPSLAEAKKVVHRMHDRLALLSKAPTLRSFSGPVLLEPKPAGLLVHEAIGHRLEGNRLLSTGEGQTFRDSLGQQILPEGFHVWDDPRMRRFEGRSLAGHYRFDDEGVPAERASLVEDGQLTGFLTSRSPISRRHRSNGHGRSRYHARAITRMGVTVMKHERGLSDAELRRAFLDEIKRQRVPYGIRILEASGGETTTDSYDFQAFLGQIDFASRVYPDGKDELVRGVDFVGTPLNALRSILAASARTEVDNAYCGAESGDIPVSTVSPALLVEELELQYKPERAYAEFAYPMPWERRRRR
jgi:predicted Zn-dependent protease